MNDPDAPDSAGLRHGRVHKELLKGRAAKSHRVRITGCHNHSSGFVPGCHGCWTRSYQNGASQAALMEANQPHWDKIADALAKGVSAPLAAQPDERGSWADIWLDHAENIARKRSTCKRLKVACVIVSVDNRYTFAIGHNGNHPGGPNTCDNPDVVGACGCLHDLENAIINNREPRETPKIVYATDSPCLMCAKRCISMGGVKAFYYRRSYRDESGLELLRANGIEVVKRDR